MKSMLLDLKRRNDLKSVWWIVPAALHFIATFLWQNCVFINENYDSDIVAINENVSLQMERLMHFMGAKILALLLICLIWNGISRVVSNIIPKKMVTIFLTLFFFLSMIHVFYFPDSFAAYEIDNYISYSYAIRNIPYYWHGALTTMYYSACMNVIPHPIAIQEFSLGFFSAFVSYCFCAVDNMKIFAFLVMILPETWLIITNPYRNSFYTILLLWTVMLVMKEIQNREKTTVLRKVIFTLMFAILAVWRTEGILYAICMFAVLLVKNREYRPKHVVGYLMLFAMFVFLISYPQKIGTSKYYGKDYLILTTTSWLNAVLNDSDVNLKYEGADRDLEAINSILPVEWVKQSGTSAFHAYNHSQGRSIVQSAASSEAQDNYMRATYRLVLHNLRPFIYNRLNLAISANGGSYQIPMDGYAGEAISLPEGVYDYSGYLWNLGAEELYNHPYIKKWHNSEFRSNVRDGIERFRLIWSDTVNVRFFCFSFAVIYVIYWMIRWIIMMMNGRKVERLDWIMPFLMLTGIAEAGLVTLGAPEARAVYYYPVYLYLMMLTCYKVENIFYIQIKGADRS